MSTNQTKNLKLHSWAPLDRFTREEFNDNWAGIDAAWGDLDGRILADVEALSAEAATRKAADDAEAATRKTNDDAEAATRKSADDAEAATRKTNDETLQKNINTETATRASADTALANRATALETRATKLETRAATLETQMVQRPVMVSGSYTGKGESGSFAVQQIELGFQPKAVFVRAKDDKVTSFNEKRSSFAIEEAAHFSVGATVTFNSTGFSVYNNPYGSHLNETGVQYFYLALA